LLCAHSRSQDLLNGPAPEVRPVSASDANTIDGCQMIARIDNQIILACEVLWKVNSVLEKNQDKIPPDQYGEFRDQLLKREIAALLDRKLIYEEFRRSVPAENIPRVEQNLIEPFEEHELPGLMKQLEVNNQHELERELARLGSSLADVRRSFNERAIASEWIRTKVKINEEVSPDEMLEYYQAHLADYEYPTQARWEELMVRRSRFSDPRAALVEICNMGNEVFNRYKANPVPGPAFADVAKAKSDGFTAKDGGAHDWTTQGALRATAIDQALFTLQVGQMSPILESEEGFHIVRVLERKEAGRKPFTEVQGNIREKLKEERFEAGIQEYLSKLRRDARIWTAFHGNITADLLLSRNPEGGPAR
jgi:hypothetical protein